jgi:hypothetical protein
MNLLSSFIFSSERPLTWSRAALALLWIVVGLSLIDVGVNRAFPYPNDLKIMSVGQLPAYFEFGRSIEGKLARITRRDPNQTAPITLAGWYQPLHVEAIGGPSGAPTVTFYGMSHSVRLARALARTSSNYHVRSIGAPGATANWAFGAFLRDPQQSNSKVAVLSIMSMTTPMVTTMTAMTWNSAFPLPYTEERFELAANGLQVVPLPFESFPDFTKSFFDPGAWSRARAQFKAHDPYYDSFMFRGSVLDKSVIIRLLRRAYGLHLEREGRARVLDEHGFHADSEEIRVMNAIVRSFATQARSQGIVPVIFVVNNLGFGTQLFDAVRGSLDRCNIPYLSSHTVVSPADPRGYLPDSHFTSANDDRLARALAKVIDSKLAQTQGTRPPPADCNLVTSARTASRSLYGNKRFSL